jgi:hypothetical protein
MTKRVIGPPRPKFHQRRREREAFKDRKESIPLSPQRALYQEMNRRSARANLGRGKIRLAQRGGDLRPLTQLQYDALNEKWRALAVELGLQPVPAELQDIW